MDKRFLGILGALVIIFVGIFAISQKSSTGNNSNNNSSQATDHVEGQGQKDVTNYTRTRTSGRALPILKHSSMLTRSRWALM
jgi:hypothetical protein